MRKLRLPGTHRAVAPETTWALVEPQLQRYGITRVADVTHLDDIGIPVVLAVRPESETLAVSQGKGATTMLARLSAVLESIELWHAERPALPVRTAACDELRLPYALTDLNVREDRASWLGPLAMRWVEATSLLDGEPVPVPLDVIRLSYSGDHFWRPRVFQPSSTGLASGNTFTEACLHAVYEAVERDAMTGLPAAGARTVVDPATIGSAHVRGLLDALDEAGVDVEITCVPSRFDVPTFAARIWSSLFPIVCAGSGSHMDACVAVSRALTEAVQSRLTEITGTRDDIPSGLDLQRDAGSDPGFAPGGVRFDEAVQGRGRDFDDLDAELDEMVRRVSAVTGHAPLVADLSAGTADLAVVRVVCPGLRYAHGRMLAA